MLLDAWNLLIERREFFLELTYEHITISLIAILIAIILGGFLGILIGEYKGGVKPTLSIVNFLYTIPAISMLGFLIPFSGVGNTSAIIALTIYALLPMVRNTYAGLNNVDPLLVEAATGMGSTRLQTLWKIKIPLAMPIIMSGIRSMVTMTIALAGIASFIGAGGLGVAIYRGITINNTTMTVVGSLIIAFLALFMDMLLGIFKRRFASHKKVKSKNKVLIIVFIFGIAFTAIISPLINRDDKNLIKIATKPMTEQLILGEMLKIVIEDETNLEVELTHGVGGGTANIHPAIYNGEFDIYPEYTGTGWNAVLKHDNVYNETMFDDMKKEYKDLYDLQWLGKFGFNNTYSLAVRKEIAEKYNLKSYTDLQAVSDKLIFGAEYDFFEREDGYNELVDNYSLNFKETMDLDIGLKYDAINQKRIDVMVIFTTDGQLSSSDIVVLNDDKSFFPSYLCFNVVRSKILEKHPELYQVFSKLENSITDKTMAKMNYEVEANGKNPKDVAIEFLIDMEIIGE